MAATPASTTASPEPAGRVAALDGLRAIAILLVLLVHFWSYPVGHDGINHLARMGRTGVDLFFVLSGYLITGILWNTRSSPRYYRTFYARRSLRIFPLYFVLLALILGLQASVRPTPLLISTRRDWPWYALYASNVLFALRGWKLESLDITWSLGVEEQFYLCWPWGIRHLSRRALVTALVAIIICEPLLRWMALAELHAGWMAVYTLTPFRLDGFAVGGLIAIVVKESLVRREQLRKWALIGVGVLGPVLTGMAMMKWLSRSAHPVFVGLAGYSMLNLFFGSLLVCTITAGPFGRRILETPALCRIGVVSYGIYLSHLLSRNVLDAVLNRFGLSVHALARAPLASGILGVLVMSAFAYVVAEVSYRILESPLLRLKERFASPALASPHFTATGRDELVDRRLMAD